MSLRSVVEVALHFESFRNIDLFHQGLYHLKTRLYLEKDGEKRNLGHPCGYLNRPTEALATKSTSKSRPDHHNLIPPHVIEDQCTFSTRSFLIRYCEEEVELNDIGQFRVELSAQEVEQGASLTLEVDLMFADLTNQGGADRFGEQPDVDSTEFKSVSTQVFRLSQVSQGIHEFVPVVFDEFHFCVASLMVHSVLLDFRLRLLPALSLTDCLYASRPAAGSSPAREELIDRAGGFYQQHVDVLNSSCTSMEEWFGKMCRACLTPGHLEAFGGSEELLSQEGNNAESANGAATLRRRLELALPPNATERSVAACFAYDVNLASARVTDVWQKALNVMLYACREIAALLRIVWEERVANQWSTCVIREQLLADVTTQASKVLPEGRAARAEELRKQNLADMSSRKEPGCVEDKLLIPKMEARPVLFEQRYSSTASSSSAPPPNPVILPSEPKNYRGIHLFVLVHGFQGNSFDMRLMKNNISLLYPDTVVLCSTSNEENTEGDISDMGIRLAQEVVNYVCDWCPGATLGRLSFIAHSMGGLIVRAALPLLHEYNSKMWTFMSLSTMHIGFLQDKMTLFNAGFWVLKQWRKSLFLQQVSMTDCQDPKETFLYRLSTAKGLEHFKHIALVSCYEDQYGPFESSRAEIAPQWDGQSEKDVYREMVNNIWKDVHPESVFRFDVNFHIPEKNLDAFIGRAAHIQFLECQPIMKMFVHNFGPLFR